MEIDPAVIDDCAGKHGKIVEVTWDASTTGSRYVQIDVSRPGHRSRPWGRYKPRGSRKTGPWASDGLTFILRDDDRRELARRTIETAPCPRVKRPSRQADRAR